MLALVAKAGARVQLRGPLEYKEVAGPRRAPYPARAVVEAAAKLQLQRITTVVRVGKPQIRQGVRAELEFKLVPVQA